MVQESGIISKTALNYVLFSEEEEEEETLKIKIE